MRIIAGTARRLPLKTVPGQQTRPTTDQIKETLFNLLRDDLYGCRFLDLFAGSGQIGLEAVSRGAAFAVFADHSREAAECIRENIAFTKFTEKAYLLVMDASSALNRLQGRTRFDIIFMDPPYNRGLERDVLTVLSRTSLLAEGGMIIVESSIETDFSYLDDLGYEIIRKKCYRKKAHTFIGRKEDAL